MRSITFLLAAVLLALLNICSFTSAESPTYLGRKECVTIKNAFFKEYLYPQTIRRGVGSRLQLFTWRKKADGPPSNWKGGVEGHNQGIWYLTRENTKECENCFKIKSVYVKDDIQTLYTVASTDPKFRSSRPRRPSFVYRGKYFPKNEGQYMWTIDTIPGGNHVMIQSKIERDIGEILYAVGDDEAIDNERRFVFTWSSKEDSEALTEQGEWIIEKVKCPSYIH